MQARDVGRCRCAHGVNTSEAWRCVQNDTFAGRIVRRCGTNTDCVSKCHVASRAASVGATSVNCVLIVGVINHVVVGPISKWIGIENTASSVQDIHASIDIAGNSIATRVVEESITRCKVGQVQLSGHSRRCCCCRNARGRNWN